MSDFYAAEGGDFEVKGLEGSFRSLLFASIYKRRDVPMVIVLNDAEEAAYFYHDMVQLVGADDVLFFPSSYKRSIRYGEVDSSNEILRTEALDRLWTEGGPVVLVSYPEAVAEKVISSAGLRGKTLPLAVGESVGSETVIETLKEFGFERVDFVYEPGQYSVRGSLIDVFSYSNEYPYRIDFFGDEIDSIRTFDIETQLSKEKKEKISVISDIHNAEKEAVSLLKFCRQDSVWAFANFTFLSDRIREIEEETQSVEVLPFDLFLSEIETFKKIEFCETSSFKGLESFVFESSPQPPFNKNFDIVAENFAKMRSLGYEIFVLSDNSRQTDRLKSIFEDRGDQNTNFSPVLKTLHSGFVDHTLKFCCYTDHQIFDRYHKYSLVSDRARKGRVALSLKELNSFQPGDFVVHIDHGVGRFGGLIMMDVNGKKQEVIKLLYQNDDLLFVSIHSLHKISKYKSKEGEPPRINKLGTGAWQSLKERTKKKVKDIARDLILLYSKRRAEKGFAFSADSFLQSELEASFIYEDTPDQLKATQDVKRDMERDLPMDRLVCGDVGFGKTEVAIRAAFKAVADNKQVAVLVPTTVLALQHFKTFSERLKDFPCRVDYLSRSRTGKAVRQVVKDLADGQINILIGTHKIIGKEVKFKDLGLLIIDEEQKFGVSVKEKIKQMKVNVDTLTMTATPIPRTLQFSLMGARDLSIISTPPPNRYPVQTELHPFNEDVLRDAIRYELDRNGQVFFVNNRIQNLQELKNLILRLVPDARVAIGHGQMDGEELEKIILDFVDYEYDVLIATSIIESGIDISNCNTILINNAQNFGLSDLHQLRGRVGRSNRRAFCYLFSPPLSTLTQEARRRLQAIESFSDLGSGFNLAMQDLDIRGAGNLLGAEQSGFIADLGYETYHKILNEAVAELKGEEFADLYQDETECVADEIEYVSDCQIDTDMELRLPDSYVESVTERMSLYRELDNIKREEDLSAFESRLVDRFGPMPEAALNLMLLVRSKWIAVRLGFERLVLKNGKMIAYFIEAEDSPYFQSSAFGKILEYFQNHVERCQLKEVNGKRSVVFADVKSVTVVFDILSSIDGIGR